MKITISGICEAPLAALHLRPLPDNCLPFYLQVVTGQQFDDEEVDELIFAGQSDQIYQKAVEGGLRGQSVKEMLGQIEQRNDQMRKLEASMLDLQQIFMDMSVLVEEQAHQLDNIEQWVSSCHSWNPMTGSPHHCACSLALEPTIAAGSGSCVS